MADYLSRNIGFVIDKAPVAAPVAPADAELGPDSPVPAAMFMELAALVVSMKKEMDMLRAIVRA